MTAPLANWNRVLTGDVHWWLAPEQQQRFLGSTGLRLDEWIKNGLAQIIKRGPHRVVYRVELPGLIFFLKHNLLPDLRSRMRQMVRPSKARLEFERWRQVADRGVPTVVPLALGEQKSPLGYGESFFATENLADTIPLIQFLTTAWQNSSTLSFLLRSQLAVELGRLLAKLHQHGLFHHDLHTGNLMIRLHEAPTPPSLFLIDLFEIRAGAPLPWEQARANLSEFNRWFLARATRSDRLRFWTAYCTLRRELGWTPPAPTGVLARQVEAMTWKTLPQSSRAFDERCWKNSKVYRRLRGVGSYGMAVAELAPAEAERIVRDPECLFEAPGVRILKTSVESTVIETELDFADGRRAVIVKRFQRASGLKALIPRQSQALRSWFFGQALMGRVIPTPRPVLVLQKRSWGRSAESYLITEKIPNSQTLADFADHLKHLDFAALRQAVRPRIDQLARLFRELHACQISNRDAKAPNWMIQDPPPPAHARTFGGFWLIDLVGVRQHRELTVSHRIKNLARLNASFVRIPQVTRTDRLRFLRIYLLWSLRGKEGWKDWWRAIERLTEAKARRYRKSGEILG